MKNREIRRAKQKLYEILNKECRNAERWDQLVALAQELNAPVPSGLHSEFPTDSINAITLNIHTVLQTEMMLNACVSAKRSCFWAAVAAIVACISVILSVILIMCSK